jgi:hypothetical protein
MALLIEIQNAKIEENGGAMEDLVRRESIMRQLLRADNPGLTDEEYDSLEDEF